MLKFTLFAGALMTMLVANGSSAKAADYAYCLKNGPGPGDCKYVTYAQCQTSVSGRRGYCERNPGIRAPRS